MDTDGGSPRSSGKNRRGFLKATLAVGALGALPQVPAQAAPAPAPQPGKRGIDEAYGAERSDSEDCPSRAGWTFKRHLFNS